MSKTYVFAVDPAKSAGYALLSMDVSSPIDQIMESGVIKDYTGLDIQRLAERIVKPLVDSGNSVIAVIEDQFLGRNPKAMKVVARRSGMWQGILESFGAPVEYIYPESWQSKELGASRLPRKERKALSRAKVRAVCGIDAGEDESDAICIARYWTQRLAIKKRLKERE